MRGMNARTGKSIAGTDHIQQSMTDILLTPIGSRVMRREYGSLVAEIIDQPLNETTLLQLRAAALIALQQWEPRVRVQAIRATINESRLILSLDAQRLDTGQRGTFEIVLGGGQ